MLQLARELGVQCPAAKAQFLAATQAVLERGQFSTESGERIHQSFEVINFTMAEVEQLLQQVTSSRPPLDLL